MHDNNSYTLKDLENENIRDGVYWSFSAIRRALYVYFLFVIVPIAFFIDNLRRALLVPFYEEDEDLDDDEIFNALDNMEPNDINENLPVLQTQPIAGNGDTLIPAIPQLDAEEIENSLYNDESVGSNSEEGTSFMSIDNSEITSFDGQTEEGSAEDNVSEMDEDDLYSDENDCTLVFDDTLEDIADQILHIEHDESSTPNVHVIANEEIEEMEQAE